MAVCVGFRCRCVDLETMRGVDCARDYVGRSMSQLWNVRKLVVFRPYDQNVAILIKSCTRDRIGRLRLVVPESAAVVRSVIVARRELRTGSRQASFDGRSS